MQSAIIPVEFLLDEISPRSGPSPENPRRLLLEADVIIVIQPEGNVELPILKRDREDGKPPRVLRITLDPRRDRYPELCALVQALRGKPALAN